MMHNFPQMAHFSEMNGGAWYQHHDMDGWLTGFHGMSVLLAVVAIALVVAVFLILRGKGASRLSMAHEPGADDTAATDLEVRFARGEIDHTEYMCRRKELRG